MNAAHDAFIAARNFLFAHRTGVRERDEFFEDDFPDLKRD